jgi:hypothetical protein
VASGLVGVTQRDGSHSCRRFAPHCASSEEPREQGLRDEKIRVRLRVRPRALDDAQQGNVESVTRDRAAGIPTLVRGRPIDREPVDLERKRLQSWRGAKGGDAIRDSGGLAVDDGDTQQQVRTRP